MNSQFTHFTLNDVWGSSASDVYAVGEGGFIAHYDGSDLVRGDQAPPSETLTGIWGSASDDYVAVGEDGTILEYDGSWTTDTRPHPTGPL